MQESDKIQVYDNQPIRTAWDEQNEELTKVQNPQGLEENRIVAKTGGKIAGDARRRIEQETGTPVITSQNANNLSSIVTGMIEGVIEKEDK